MVSRISGSSSANYQSDTSAPSPEGDPVWEAMMSAGKTFWSANKARVDEASKELAKEPEKDEDDPDSQPV